MYLITGATGNIGKHVVAQLVATGAPVRVFTRTPAKAAHWGKSVEVAEGDLSKPESIGPALIGVKATFLLLAGDGDGTAAVRNYLAAAKTNGSPRTVLLSSIGAGSPMIGIARQHAAREQLLAASGLEWTVLRPGMFMSNSLQWARTIKAERAVYTPHGDGRTAPMAPADIAAVAVKALTTALLLKQTLELTGAELFTAAHQVELLASTLGFGIRCIQIPTDAAVAAMVKNGMPQQQALAIGELADFVRKGGAASVSDTFTRVMERKPQTLQSWFSENAAAWR